MGDASEDTLSQTESSFDEVVRSEDMNVFEGVRTVAIIIILWVLVL